MATMRTVLFAVLLSSIAATAAAQTRAPFRDVRATNLRSPSHAVAGADVTFDVVLESTGTLPVTADWTAYLTVGGALTGARELRRFPAVQLAAGESRAMHETVPLPLDVSGRFRLAVVVDLTTGEANEYDNVAEGPDLRVRAQSPDVSVRSVSVGATSLPIGGSLTVDARLRNAGELATTIDVSAHASAGAAISRDDPQIARQAVTIPAGATVNVRLSGALPAGVGPGDVTIGVIADPDLAVDEPIETDNLLAAPSTLNVFASEVTLVTPSLPGGTVFLRYLAHLSATGGNGHYAFSLKNGRLPRGISLDGATGDISGTVLESGTHEVEIEVTSRGYADAKRYSITVAESGIDLRIVTTELIGGTVALPYSAGIVASGGEPPYAFSFTSGALPPGLDLNPVGWLSGVPEVRGEYTFAVEVEDRLGARDQAQFTVIVDAAQIIISSGQLAPVPVGEPIDVELQATGGRKPYRWIARSAPPPGLTVSEDGHLRGIPSRVGDFVVRVEASDSSRGEASDTALLHLTVEENGVFEISTKDVPAAVIRELIRVPLQASGGEPPLEWRLVAGDSLPQGFHIVPGEQDPNREAFLTGSSIRPIEHSFAVEVKDAAGRRRETVLAIRVYRPEDLPSSGGCRCLDAKAPSSAWLALSALALLASRRRRR